MRWFWVAVLLVIAAAVMAVFGSCDRPVIPGFSPAEPAPGSPTRTQVEQLLAQVRVVAARHDAIGYERGCKSGEGGVFGPAGTDDDAGPNTHPSPPLHPRP